MEKGNRVDFCFDPFFFLKRTRDENRKISSSSEILYMKKYVSMFETLKFHYMMYFYTFYLHIIE